MEILTNMTVIGQSGIDNIHGNYHRRITFLYGQFVSLKHLKQNWNSVVEIIIITYNILLQGKTIMQMGTFHSKSY